MSGSPLAPLHAADTVAGILRLAAARSVTSMAVVAPDGHGLTHDALLRDGHTARERPVLHQSGRRDRLETAGRAVPGALVRVVDPTGEPLPHDGVTIGERTSAGGRPSPQPSAWGST